MSDKFDGADFKIGFTALDGGEYTAYVGPVGLDDIHYGTEKHGDKPLGVRWTSDGWIEVMTPEIEAAQAEWHEKLMREL
jgi:hypothetical protein